MRQLMYAFCIISALLWSVISFAQTEKELLAGLAEKERTGIEALVVYPESIRLSILEITQHPGLLIKISNLQKQTGEAFKNLLVKYDAETQKAIWDLTRYPDLIRRMVAREPDDYKGLDQILAHYPEVIHQRARKIYRRHFDSLQGIEGLNQQTTSAYRTLLKPYPVSVRDAMEQLIESPEVLSILSGHIELAILAGEVYKTDPEWVLQKADSLSLVFARQNVTELEDWKASLKENPQIMAELQQSAKAYREDAGNDDLYYELEDYEYDDLFYDEEEYEEDNVIEHHYYYHYPYWYGYPYWYDYPRWRPFPWWYDWGFYFGSGGVSVILRLPAYHIVDWYFYYPHHHYYYPHLSGHLVSHYYGHRHTGSNISRVVARWKYENRDVVSDQWLSDNSQRIPKLQEFGEMETDRLRYNVKRPDKQLSQREFINKYPKKYPRVNSTQSGRETDQAPGIKRDLPQRKIPPKTTIPSRTRRPARVPSKRNETILPSKTPRKTGVPSRTATPKKTVPRKKITTLQKINRARDYHRQSWDRKTPARVLPGKTAPPKKATLQKTKSRSPKKN